MDWDIIEQDKFTQQDIDRQGIKLLIGNGYIGYRGTLEEFNKRQRTATIVSGLYDKVGDQWREPINLPNGCFVSTTCNGENLHLLESKVLAHTQSLNMQLAIHERQTTFQTRDGIEVTVRARRFASLTQHQMICMEYAVSADRECEIDILTGIDGDVWDINGPHLCGITTGSKDELISVYAATYEKTIPICVSEAVSFSNGNDHYEIKDEKSCPPSIFRKIHVSRLNKPFIFYKFIAHSTGLDSAAPLEDSRELCLQALQLGYDKLLKAHTEMWKLRWSACDIQIEGDTAAQQAIRFSQYHLLSIVPAHTEHASIPARGISGQMYKGAIFWDTEIFMLPFFTHTFPELARSLLRYRYHTLDGARRKAKEYGYRGAFYAWESQDNGDDACTLFNVTDVFTNRPMRTYFRDKQVHISADIAYAFWKYFCATNDETFWQDGGAEVVFECARFFLSYIYYNPDKDRYEILDVTGPDEYHERVHNNAFTNRHIAHTFEICLKVAEFLRQKSNTTYAHLIESLNFTEDLLFIEKIDSKLYLPDEVHSEGIIPQFDGYLKLEDVPIHSLTGRKLDPNEYLGGGNGLATTTQIIKQADVMLMLYLFNERYSQKTKTANWEFYEPRTEHGSSLSLCSYSLIASQIGRIDWAYNSFMRTATIDMVGEGKQFVGTLYIGGTHSASDGGAWMAVVFGLCGIQTSGGIIQIDPHLPSHWKKVTLPFIYQEQQLQITLTHGSVTVKSLKPLQIPLEIKVGESTYLLQPKDELVIRLSNHVPLSVEL
jgi:trehalose/maltose hydrolase-like predicted phosphorylase